MTNPVLDLLRPQSTGGRIVTFKPGVSLSDGRTALRDAAGGVAHVFSALDENVAEVAASADVTLFGDTGVAFVPDRPGRSDMQVVTTRLLSDERIAMVRPEFYLYALEPFADTEASTWGVEAVGALASPFTGAGIKVAVLDTGLDFDHSDFVGRDVVSQSFVEGEAAEDAQGHGTHCVGTAAGGAAGATGMRYGVASECSLHVGKVLNNQGFGRERDVIAAIQWAIERGCAVISMSLGRAVRPGEPPEPDYIRLGEVALGRGSLIVAAAGNDSSRTFGHIAPVGSPANAPSIMAVAALDPALAVAAFSNGGLNPAGGEVDIAAPGVGVLSAAPRPQLYTLLSGTSMACPHVAGVAALWAQSDPDLRGQALWDKLVATARDVGLSRRDVGAGMAQAPGPDTPAPGLIA